MIRAVLLEQGTYGRRAVLTSSWSEAMNEILVREQVVELELNQGKGWTGADIRFVSRLTGLLSFEIFHFNIRDIQPIHDLHKLRRLGVTTYCSTALDFGAFPELESCGLEWRPGAESLFACTTLTDLFVNRYKGKDCRAVSGLTRLESLALLNAPLKSLDGLEGLTRLRSLRLAGLRALRELRGIEQLTNLEELDVHSCRGISSIDEVGQLQHLRKFHLNEDGPIASLKPLDKLSGLESIVFYGSTNIVDGDLSPLARQKNLLNVSFQNRRHYSHRREEFAA
jgi:Leucine-rich repeat (LRR) protein